MYKKVFLAFMLVTNIAFTQERAGQNDLLHRCPALIVLQNRNCIAHHNAWNARTL